MSRDSLGQLSNEITECRACPRLVEWRELVARDKRAAFRDEDYWGRPVPGFGDPAARVLVLGLALAVSANAGANAITSPERLASAGVTAPTPVEIAVVRVMNSVRATNGVPPLRIGRALSRAARAHSVDMARRGYFDHGPFAQRLRRFGVRAPYIGENLASGTKPLPAAAIVLTAHEELERLVGTIHQNQFKPALDQKWGYLVYAGLWWEPLRTDLDAYMEAVNAQVTGEIGLRPTITLHGARFVYAQDELFARR